MKITFLIVTTIIIINYILNIINYISGRHAYKSKKRGHKKDNGNMYLLLPVYHEEKIAEVMLDRFYKVSKESNIITVVITTIKEHDNKTHNIIEKKIKKDKMGDHIILIKCPYKEGTMATQLNYAIEELSKIDKTNFIFGIHNADGIISKEHISFVRKNVDTKTCVQSYSYFDNPGNILMNGPVSWQNRWSYIFEAGRCNLKLGKSALFRKMNYVIGHGLYMKRSTIEDVGYFPEDTINEDAFLGAILNYKDYNLIPLPYLEKADFAPSPKVYIKQQCTWFNGPKSSFDYYKRIINNEKNVRYARHIYEPSIKNNLKALIICSKLFLHAIYWISAVYILFILYGYICFNLFGPLSLIYVYLVNAINIVLFNYLSFRQIKKETSDNITFPLLQLPIIFYFLHSFGPILNVFKSIIGKNTIKNKYKTER
jgi:cellulose synthase/poly-beta-1,6-N-acetylglucosamine synthase-like glycosyltransferase